MVIHAGLSEKLDIPTLGSLPGIAVVVTRNGVRRRKWRGGKKTTILIHIDRCP